MAFLVRRQQDVWDPFQDFFRTWGVELAPVRANESSVWAPKLDVSEDEQALRVTAELPGLEEKDVEVTFADGVLTIQGEKRAEQEQHGKQYHRIERSYGAFHRSIQLPVDVDQEKVSASFKQGVLTVVLPKAADTRQQTKKIAVKSE